MTGPYVLILGGCDKGERFGSLRFPQPPRAIVAYGETAGSIQEDLASRPVQRVDAFRDACLAAQDMAQPGDIVLLAPACASFDQFDNFGQRGRVFKQIFAEGQRS
jgi:UDP-N-acetylmuramoylalanine--D-glutamate ligase